MEAIPRKPPHADAVGGLFVIGASDPPVAVVGECLSALGLPQLAPSDEAAATLRTANDRLLQMAAGSRENLPGLATAELLSVLDPRAPESRAAFDRVAAMATDTLPGAYPWVWADPANAWLLPFWTELLGIRPAVVFVHEDLDHLSGSSAWQWYLHGRHAIVHVSEHLSLVLDWRTALDDPAGAVVLLGELLESASVAVGGSSSAAIDRLVGARSTMPTADERTSPVPKSYTVFDELTRKLQGVHDPQRSRRVFDPVLTQAFYDADYYLDPSYAPGVDVPYSRGEPYWVDFFRGIARHIADSLHPRRVLDAGCAIGLLVEALREAGIDGWGIDISQWAIDQVPDAFRPYCRVASITDELQGDFDLITCIEVVEHLPAFAADQAIGNLCRHAGAVLFSSTSDDFDEPTHLNVRDPGYWAQLFLEHGFVRDPDYDASFLTPHAVLYRKGATDAASLVGAYERALSNVVDRNIAQMASMVAENRRLVDEATAASAVGDRISAESALLRFERAFKQLLEPAWQEEAQYHALLRSRTMRYTNGLRRVYGVARRIGRRAARPSTGPVAATHGPTSFATHRYGTWVRAFDTMDTSGRLELSARVAELTAPPTISVVLPVFDPEPELLRAAIESIRNQIYPHWELCIADDASTDPRVEAVLGEYRDADHRIKVLRRAANGHICAATNDALSLASGEWVAFLDHDDVLAPHALAWNALTIDARDDVGMIYSDEDKLDEDGARCDPYFKSDFDPLLLLAQNYLTHFLLIRRDLVAGVGGMRLGYEGSQDWDLALRVSEQLEPAQVAHIPRVLYSWRVHARSTASGLAAKPYATDAGRRAVEDHLRRRGLRAEISTVARSGHNRIKWALPDPRPTVSIVVPTRDGRYLTRCIDSLVERTDYSGMEIVVVDNGSEDQRTLEYLESRRGRLRVVRDERPFNYSGLNNAAVGLTDTDAVVLLNDDTEIVDGGWLDEMMSQLYQPRVGAVGAKLYYDSGQIQHAGVVLGIGGVAGHPYRLAAHDFDGCMGRLLVPQTMSAVTAACMAVRRQAWDEVGGLDEENLAIAFNDVDFCLRLCEQGWRVVWTPFAELIHHESVSRGSEEKRAAEFEAEVRYMKARWGSALRSDPAYNPNLSLVAEDWSLAWPPRVF